MTWTRSPGQSVLEAGGGSLLSLESKPDSEAVVVGAGVIARKPPAGRADLEQYRGHQQHPDEDVEAEEGVDPGHRRTLDRQQRQQHGRGRAFSRAFDWTPVLDRP